VHTITTADTDAEILRCFPVMAQLRPHLVEAEFVGRVRHLQQIAGYTLAALEEGGAIRCVAGFRISEALYCGRYLYVDDLVTDQHTRSQGYGGALLDWLVGHAKNSKCDVLRLDSGVQRTDAHRFYFAKGMEDRCRHFILELG
jgi:GNAT superfamily N-acetyltransferase